MLFIAVEVLLLLLLTVLFISICVGERNAMQGNPVVTTVLKTAFITTPFIVVIVEGVEVRG